MSSRNAQKNAAPLTLKQRPPVDVRLAEVLNEQPVVAGGYLVGLSREGHLARARQIATVVGAAVNSKDVPQEVYAAAEMLLLVLVEHLDAVEAEVAK